MTRLNLPPLTVEDYERAAWEYCRSLPLEHFMEAKPQAVQREITLESLALLRAQRPDVQVFNEMLVQYPLEGGLGQVVPDNMVVVSKEPTRAEGSFNLPFEPACIFEVLMSADDGRHLSELGQSKCMHPANRPDLVRNSLQDGDPHGQARVSQIRKTGCLRAHKLDEGPS